MDSARKPQPAKGRSRRYQFVSEAEGYGARIKRFRLARMDALSRLEPRPRSPRAVR